MTPTPFKRRLPASYAPSIGVPSFQWWPWPIGSVSSGFGLDYPSSNGILPPRDVLDWLSVAEWRFEIELDDYFGGSPQSVDQLVKPGSRYVKTYDMGSPELQGRPSTSLVETMRLGYESGAPAITDDQRSFCGIEMSWREVIDDFRYTYGFVIDLTFPGFSYNDDDDPVWSMGPVCEFYHETSDAGGGSPTSSSSDYVNFLGRDYNAAGVIVPPENWITLSRVTIGSML